MKRSSAPRAALLSLLFAGCTGDGGTPATDGSATQPDLTASGGDGGGVGDMAAGDMAVPTGECGKPANLARRSQLLAAQPGIEGKGKKAITVAATWSSLADDPNVTCTVDLLFKDLNGSGALDAYEDWRKSPAERATDLLGRMTADQRLALLAHPTLADSPASSTTPSAATAALIDAGVRFGLSNANSSAVVPRATWANAVQERCEATPLGVPFVLSSDPAHSVGNGRTKAKGFSQWPQELGLAAGGDTAKMEAHGKIVSQELRAIGVRMLMGPPADLATEPRWSGSQFTFGEDSATVAALAAAFVKGAQGAALGQSSIACVIGHYPGAGPARGGWDARLAKGKATTYPGGNIDAHLAAFQQALDGGVAGVMPGYGVPASGAWSGAGGKLDGQTIEQVGAPFNKALLTDALRGQARFGGLVVSPWGAVEDAGNGVTGAPWGVEQLTRPQRIGKAIGAGVDQIGGLSDTAPLAAAKAASLLTDNQIDAAATRALVVAFGLGLFEDPFVDPAKAASLTNTDDSYHAALDAQGSAMALVVNRDKPLGWLNGVGDGSQMGDKGNAGNGSKKVLPAPPGEPYVSAGCAFFVAGSFDLDYVRSVSAGYGELTIDEATIRGMPANTDADKMALSDYIFIRIAAPCSVDPDSSPLGYCKTPLEYAASDNKAALDLVAQARAAIDAHPGSQAQIIVGVDAGRASVVSEILKYNVSGLYLEWTVTDKVFLDVAFGIVNGKGRLPVGLPLSDAAAAAQKEDVAGDGQDPTFVRGYGFDTRSF